MRRSRVVLLAPVVLAGALGAGASCGGTDVPVFDVSADAGIGGADALAGLDAGTSCGALGEPCCDAGCLEDGSFCAIDHSCRAARPTDVGTPCTKGANCQSGLCAYVGAFDASTGAGAPYPSVCSEPCWNAGDCSSGWTCWTQPTGPIVTGPMGPGTCVCTPIAETCDGKDDNCDGIVDEEPAASMVCTATLGLPAKCVDAGCVCTELCDGGCVDLASDSKNCGACGTTCTPGLEVCSGSRCVCGGGGTVCPIPAGGLGDAGHLLPEGGPDGAPAICVNEQSDPSNCGGCGLGCTYTCAGGCVPMLLATLSVDADAGPGTVPAGAVASNGAQVIVLTSANGGVVLECGVTGCNQNPVVIASALDNTNNTSSFGLLALAGGWAFWPRQTAIDDVTITTPVASVFAHPVHSSVYAIATNTTDLFWSDLNLGILGCAIGAACASPGVLVPLASIAAPPQVVAADASYVYFSDANGDFYSSPVGGGSPVLLAAGNDAGFSYPTAMTAAAGRVYYLDSNVDQLTTAPGGSALSAAVYFPDHVSALATDGVNLYWGNGRAIFKCALGASCATAMPIYGGTNATSLAVDATNIYWIDDGSLSGSIPRLWEFHK